MTVVAISAVKKRSSRAQAAKAAAPDAPAKRASRAGAKASAAAQKKPLPDLNEHILRAFELAGGDAYLAEVARSHPSAFMSLLVKVLPLQLADDGAGGALHINKVERVLIHPKA